MPVDIPAPREGQADWLDVRPILDAELGKLPAKLRDILVLCLLEGSTAEEAAHRLSCPLGTVKSRLARGREALRGRLAARGLAPAAALAVAVAHRDRHWRLLCLMTLSLTTSRMAGLRPDRIPHAVFALTRGATTSMRYKSSVLAAVVCGGIALAGAGLATWAKSQATAAEPAAQAGGDATDRAKVESINHLKLVMLAFPNYVQFERTFSTQRIPGPDGQPNLSWRVALLPYLDHPDLYEAFHHDEPWDSPHNKALIARMPDDIHDTELSNRAGDHASGGFEGRRHHVRRQRGREDCGHHGRNVEHDHDRRSGRGGPLDPSG